MKDKLITTDIFQIKLAVDQLPKYSIDKQKGIIKSGKKNDFPEYLLFLLNNHAEHGAIVKGKARYLSGSSIKTSNESQVVKDFLAKANPKESWYDLRKKSDLDKATFGGAYFKVVTNIIGVPIQWWHIEFGKVRIKDDYENYEIREDWDQKGYYNSETTILPKYKEGFVGTSVYFLKGYTPSLSKIQSAYPQPEYMSCTLDIDTDIRVSTFFNSLVKNSFSAGNLITIFNGSASDKEAKKDIVTRLKGEHNGEDNAGNTVVAFAAKDAKGAEIITLNANDLDKQYQEVSKRNQQKILSGHNVNGILFKIKTEGQLGGRSEIIEAHELFINEYAKIEQLPFNQMLSKWCKLKTGQDAEFEVEQVKPIGRDLTEPNTAKYFSEDEIRESLGYAPRLGAANQDGTPIQESQANESIKSMSRSQTRNLLAVVSDYNKGRTSKQQAVLLLKGYGLNEADAIEFLGIAEEDGVPVKQSDERSKKFVEWAKLNLVQIDESDEVVSVEFVNFKNSTEAIKYESIKLKDYISDPGKYSPTELRNAILNQLKGNPYLTVEELAKNFQTDPDVIREQISWLKKEDYLDETGEAMAPTEKGINKTTETVETEVYTVYKYGLRPDVSGPLVKDSTRDFCRDMVALTKGDKRLTFEKIDSYSNEFGESAWDFRGGFYNDGKTTTPWCRHIWVAETRIRRKKK